MAIIRITNGYDRMSDAEVLEKCLFIHQQVSTKTTLFPTPVPAMLALKDSIDEYQASMSSAQTGDTAAISQKNQNRDLLIDKMHQLGNYVQLTANGNPQLVVEAGMADEKPRTAKVLGEAVIETVGYTGTSGELKVAAKCPNAKGYVVQFSSDPELKPESWKSMKNSTASRCLVTGLTPGTVYFIRMQVSGSRNQSTYSNIVSKMAV